MEKTYCIYSDSLVDKDYLSIEHIIPKSLGGSDDFIILVDRQKNSILGSKVDGAYVNDPIVKLKLIHTEHRGHSRKEQKLKIKKSSIDNKPMNVTFKKKGIEIYDPIAREQISSSGRTIKARIAIKKDTRVKFIAKVALAAGYFILGEYFVKYADHCSLRRFIFSENIPPENCHLRFIDSLFGIEEKDKAHVGVNKFLIQYLEGTSVILQICQTNIILEIGIDGEYIGGVSFKADSNKIPYTDDIRLGKVINIRNGEMKEISYWEAIYEMSTALKIVEVDDLRLDR